ncbi:MAG: response regulator [Betaproteobacteria bacterium HGW-Betaproteobacteria-13]|uniref:Response regulator n=1 Tax=Parazoarcus communis TaxID=41977 RepID=A0A2U8H413_9RHOO|nr:response regulator transcription factor [Parazoarcus communis]AWI80444.1 response regulator [Parazoarcus communis]PKO58791.1 MAG: response regulator [Betaproteobacteria bacterium HGW-Betaproteobacteria-19]PKO79250.1 MAG: response regulator [Betaproteobacteria bacterium HGW-Betaproteobacteria-13]
MTRASKKIIVVDDNEVIRMALRAILRQAGFNVVGEARDGEAVIELVEKLGPDLVCLDVMMPGRSGLEVLTELRERFPALKVLMITGLSDRDTVTTVVDQGAVGMVLKPFNSARVVETVSRVLGLSAPE